jgi:hypothetical protein
MDWMSWTKFTRFLSLKGALAGLAGLGIATAGYVSYGGDGPNNWTDNGSSAPGVVRGAPGPVAGAGLPIALIAVGYGVYRLVRRRQKSV